MTYYQMQQKEERLKENLLFQFSKGLSWFLRTVVMLLGMFVKAFVEAIKMLFRTS
jgi:hypothetical protein